MNESLLALLVVSGDNSLPMSRSQSTWNPKLRHIRIAGTDLRDDLP